MSSSKRFKREYRARQVVTPMLLDSVVEEWIQRVKAIGSIVTDDDIQATAARAARLIGFLGFEPTKQWLTKFKRENHHSNKQLMMPIYNSLLIQKSLSLKRIIYELRPMVWQFNQDSSSDSDPEVKRPPVVVRQYGKKRIKETEDNLKETSTDKAEDSNRGIGDNQDISKRRSRHQVQQKNEIDLNTNYNILKEEAEALKPTYHSRNINTESTNGEENCEFKVESEVREEGMTATIFENDSYSIFRLKLKPVLEEENEEMSTCSLGLYSTDKVEGSNRCIGHNQDISKRRSRHQVQQTNKIDLNTNYNILNEEAEALKTTFDSRKINAESTNDGEENCEFKVKCEVGEEGMTATIFENDSYSIFRLNSKSGLEEENEEMSTCSFGLLEPKHELITEVTEGLQNINSSIKMEEDDIQNEEVKQSPVEKEIRSYEDALYHLALLEQFILINRETEAVELLKQLKNIIKKKT